MSIKKILLLMGLCVLFAGCSTGRYSDGPEKNISATDMGVRYLLGRGVPRDDAKAFYYFNQAANEGDPFAQNEVAFMYASGKGTQRDYAQAVKYYQKAADHDLASAQFNLGMMYQYGMGTQPNRELAVFWYRKAAAHGFEPAKQALARVS